MRRLTAKLVLLSALLGNFIPLAVALAAEPTPACCRRQDHHCHGMTGDSEREMAGESENGRSVRGTCCCDPARLRALTRAAWADSEKATSNHILPTLNVKISAANSIVLGEPHSSATPPRGPPSWPIA